MLMFASQAVILGKERYFLQKEFKFFLAENTQTFNIDVSSFQEKVKSVRVW